MVYISVAIVVPLLLVIYIVATGANKKQIHGASNLMKVAMLTRILYSVVVKAIITFNLLGNGN